MTVAAAEAQGVSAVFYKAMLSVQMDRPFVFGYDLQLQLQKTCLLCT